MTIILYPNNQAFTERHPSNQVGTNETYGIPEIRRATSGSGLEGVRIYQRNGIRIKAFYNADYCLPSKVRKRKMLERLRRKLEQKETPR